MTDEEAARQCGQRFVSRQGVGIGRTFGKQHVTVLLAQQGAAANQPVQFGMHNDVGAAQTGCFVNQAIGAQDVVKLFARAGVVACERLRNQMCGAAHGLGIHAHFSVIGAVDLVHAWGS